MDAKLIIIGGSKAGTEIPLKKERFTIGRSAECSLRAGSDAISRRHCEIRLTPTSVTIADLGSRNGTIVNGSTIQETTSLKSGDQVAVGPLRFEVAIIHGIDTTKRPHVKDVADATARTAEKSRKDHEDYETSITQWLTSPASDSVALNETSSFRMDETSTKFSPGSSYTKAIPPATPEPTETEMADAASKKEESDAEDAMKKTKPGKLPPVPQKPKAKDSRDAAAEILREMTRRR